MSEQARPQAALVAELMKREADARVSTEKAAAEIVSRYENDDELARACGRFLEVFAAANLKIRTKQGGPLWPFVLNWIQVDYLKGLRQAFTGGEADLFRGVRDLIVKPRQLGFSTFIAALFFMDGFLEPGRISVILTHDEKISKELLRTYRLFYDELPPELKVGTRLKSAAANVYEIEFEGVPEVSRFEIRTEKGTEWRGGTIHNLHASEAAFYERWANFFASYVQAVPASGNIIFETTCNGRNEFYEEVMLALNNANGYRVIFYEWFKHPEYRLPWNPETQSPITPEEQALIDKHGLDLEQIAWRRWKISEVKDKFPQEYPETLLGAFLATGRPFFFPAAVDRGYERAKKFWAEVDEGKRPRPRNPRQFVTIYEDPIPGELYVLSGDVAEGIDKGSGDGEKGGKDFHAAFMTKASTLEVVATVHTRSIPPVEFAEILNRLGRLYQAVVAVERNNHGHTVIASLQKAEYPELYHHAEYNEAGQKFLKAGFPTTTTTRPMMLDALDTVIRRDGFICYDLGFWQEADRFIRNEKTGKPEAMKSWHDDRIMGAGIGVYLCTLGRTAWGIEANETRDGVGFPRTPESYGAQPAPAPPKPVVKPTPEPPAAAPRVSAWASMRKSRAAVTPETPIAELVPNNAASIPNLPPALSLPTSKGQVVVDALEELREAKKRRCRECMKREPLGGGSWCSLLHMRVNADDPACNHPLGYELPEDESEDAILESDFGGENTWK